MALGRSEVTSVARNHAAEEERRCGEDQQRKIFGGKWRWKNGKERRERGEGEDTHFDTF